MTSMRSFFRPTGVKITLALILILPALLLGPSYQEIKSCKTTDCGLVNNIYFQTSMFINGFLSISSSFLHSLGISKAQEIIFWMLIITIASGYYLVSCEVFLAYKRVLKASLARRNYIRMIKSGVFNENKVRITKYKPLHEESVFHSMSVA